MGFDIAVVVAIDLVLAVGLLQIQNCLDSAKAKKKYIQNVHPLQNRILIKQQEHRKAYIFSQSKIIRNLVLHTSTTSIVYVLNEEMFI